MKQRIIIRNPGEYIPQKAERFFFDTSVWLYMYGPTLDVRSKATKIYSRLFKDILQLEGQIVIDYLVVAEFINRYLHDYHKFLKENNGAPERWKQFRRTAEYRECVKGLADELYQFLDACQKLQLQFEMADLSNWTDEFAGMEIDFNDVIYWKTCAQHELIFVTHDGDCNFGDIQIISANPKLGRSTQVR